MAPRNTAPASLFHPLCGANAGTLSWLLTRNGPISPRRLPQAAIAVLACLLRWPFSTAERLAFDMTRGRRPPLPAPVFIVGHWRSGTTHFHNVLAHAGQFGRITPLATGLPWDLLGIVRALRPLLEKALPSDRHVDGVAVDPDSPQEDSIALANMIRTSYYHGVYFPRRFREHFDRGVFFEDCTAREIQQWRDGLVYLLEKVDADQGGKRLLIKNPVYSAHLPKLESIWPDARFIHVYRNPYKVFPSTCHFYRRLLPELALQDHGHVDVEALVLRTYTRLMTALLRDARALPPQRYAEVRFEDFERDPVGEIERVYTQLELHELAAPRPAIRHYMAGLSGYRKNVYPTDAAVAEQVTRHWRAFVEHWGYLPDG